MISEVERIKKILDGKGYNPESELPCSCDKCKNMCKSPCLGTPRDIEAIMDAGFADKLSITKWFVGAIMAGEDPIDMIAPAYNNGWCAFRKEDGLCELHDLGLKPTEGVLTSCRDKEVRFEDSVTRMVAGEWIREDNMADVTRVVFKLLKANR